MANLVEVEVVRVEIRVEKRVAVEMEMGTVVYACRTHPTLIYQEHSSTGLTNKILWSHQVGKSSQEKKMPNMSEIVLVAQ